MDPTSSGGGCSDINLLFSTSANSFSDGWLTCYDSKGVEMEVETTLIRPGSTCIFLSNGHVDRGGFAVEMLCEDPDWKVTLTQL